MFVLGLVVRYTRLFYKMDKVGGRELSTCACHAIAVHMLHNILSSHHDTRLHVNPNTIRPLRIHHARSAYRLEPVVAAELVRGRPMNGRRGGLETT
jgi:hypothetical protein